MRKFLLYTLGVFAAVLILMIILEIAYTHIYTTSNPRTKVQYLLSMKNKKIDYIFLGSSRVENGIVPNLIEAKTGKKAVNLGFQASKLNDIFTVLKLVKNNNIRFEKIFIQVDYIYNIDGYSNMLEYELIPFVSQNEIIKEHLSNIPNIDKQELKLPFVRYMSFDQKVGFREFFLNAIGKEITISEQKGYCPIYGHSITSTYDLPEEVVAENKTFTAIRNYCNQNNINVIFFCAPFHESTKHLDYIDKLKTKIPELKDFSRAVTNSEMFQNSNHLNDAGAQYFTEVLITKCIKNK